MPPPSGPNKLRRSQYESHHHTAIGSMHWLFRTNVPRRRTSYIAPDIRKRNFFGIGEIVGVLTNPAETVRSLTESKRLLDEARMEINENRERSQIRPKHTFSRLPGFLPRQAEVRAIEKTLEGEPAFTVLFGASSVGKTALLREVLCREQYHVLHFDLRIAGFADLASLYLSLSTQMEGYFEAISNKMEGYKEFEKEAWSFKHDRLNVERRVNEAPPDSGIHRVKTSDIAGLMELFQSSLLKYWEFEPFKEEREQEKRESDHTSDETRVNSSANGASSSKKWRFENLRKKKHEGHSQHPKARSPGDESSTEKKREQPAKKIPVIFFDEAHKLPALIKSTETMNSLLSTFLVLTKQDRLCHVIHATSDPFYHTWLRQLNAMQHCKIMTIGDCSKAETRVFFRERMLPRVPEHLQHGLDFEVLYDAFGGKLVHWQDFVTDYVNSKGRLDVKQSSHFLQAHALLNLHVVHSSQPENAPPEGNRDPAGSSQPLNGKGFKIYSAISNPRVLSGSEGESGEVAAYYESDFTADQLLKVMSRITEPGINHLPYFLLCRELGVRAVDGMIKGRILDLRWTEPVTNELELEEESYLRHPRQLSVVGPPQAHADTASDEGDMSPVSEREVYSRQHDSRRAFYRSSDALMDVIGPKLVPTTPIVKFAMREVLREYEDIEEDASVSEYASAASLSDMDEE